MNSNQFIRVLHIHSKNLSTIINEKFHINFDFVAIFIYAIRFKSTGYFDS